MVLPALGHRVINAHRHVLFKSIEYGVLSAGRQLHPATRREWRREGAALHNIFHTQSDWVACPLVPDALALYPSLCGKHVPPSLTSPAAGPARSGPLWLPAACCCRLLLRATLPALPTGISFLWCRFGSGCRARGPGASSSTARRSTAAGTARRLPPTAQTAEEHTARGGMGGGRRGPRAGQASCMTLQTRQLVSRFCVRRIAAMRLLRICVLATFGLHPGAVSL